MQQDTSIDIPGIDLANQFSASTAGRQHRPFPAHGNNGADAAFPMGDHAGDGSVLGTKAETACRVDADANMDRARGGDQGAAHVADFDRRGEPPWIEHGGRSGNKVGISNGGRHGAVTFKSSLRRYGNSSSTDKG